MTPCATSLTVRLPGSQDQPTTTKDATMKTENRMLLQDKTAIVYGAGGAIGGAVARAFGYPMGVRP